MDVQINKVRFTGKAAGSVLLTLAAALALWLFIAANHRKAAIADISRSLETINSYKTAQISAWLDDHRREALRLSRHPFLAEIISAELAKPGSRRAGLSAWLKDHTEQKRYASMAFLSQKGKLIAATPGRLAETKKEFAEHLALALRAGTAQVTDLYLDTGGLPRIAIFSPISAGGRGGKPVCVLAISINLENRFYPILKAAPLFFTEAETLLVRKEGEKALFLNPLEHRDDAALKFTRPLSEERLPAAAALRGITGFFQGVDYRGVKVFSAIGPVPGTNWALITKVDRETVIAPAKNKEQLNLAIILLGAGLLYLLVYSILRSRRRAAEAALEKSRNLLTETERISKVGGWEYSIDTNELECTAEVCRIHELPPDYKFDLSRDTSFYTPASRPLIERAMRSAIENGEGFDLELEILTAKGNLRAIHVIGRPDTGNRKIYGFFQDITERRQAESERQKIERIFTEFMEHSPIYVFFKDKDLRSLHLSRNYETMLGRPMKEILGKSMDDLFPSDLAKSMIEDDKRIINEGKEVVVEEELNGRFYKTIKFPIKIEGKPAYLAGYTIDITEGKLAEQALKKSERELKEAQKLARLGNWSLDLTSDKLHWSDEIYSIFGIDRDKFGASYEAFLEAVHPEDRDFVNKAYTDSLKTKSPYNITHRLLMRDGSIKYVNECCETFYDKKGKPLRSVGTVQDITELKLAEEKLRESEERLRVTLEVTQIGTWDWNVETDTWSASPTYYTMLGYDPEQGPGDRQAWLNRVHPDDKEMIAGKIRGVLSGVEAKYQYEARIKHADGTYRWQAVLGKTVKRGEGGRAARIMGVRMDITEQKLAAERLAKLSDMVPGVVYQYRLYPDGRSCFPYASVGMQDIYEVSPEEVREDATPVFGRLHPEDLQGTSEAIMASARDNSIFHWEFRVVLPRQGLRWRMCDARPERQPDGGTLWHGIITDITERRLAEMELEKLNRDLVAKRQEMENFLYITSHDLRTPLVNIQGFTQNLERYLRELKEELSPERTRQPLNEAVSKLTDRELPGALKFVLESSHKMDSLINSLLKVARLGRVEMKPGHLEMNDLLRKIVDSTSYQLEAAGGAAKIGVLPPCKADPAAVSQIFANLLENAIKYRAEGRALAVTITGETRGASVLYKVADNGSGIAAKDLNRIWDIFYRGAGAGEGEGIGLTVVKYMAEKNGGSVRAESEEGRGTMFYLELPAAGGTK